MTSQEVKAWWREFNSAGKEYFESFDLCVRMANKKMEGRIAYGQESSNAEAIGEWCQCFWEALPDTPSIRRGYFWKVCDIADWWCFGDD